MDGAAANTNRNGYSRPVVSGSSVNVIANPVRVAPIPKVWKGPKTGARTPTPFSDELVEGRVENRTVCCPLERLIAVVTKPDDRLCPSCRIVRIAWQIAPEDGAAFVGELPRKGAINSDKSILNELFYLRVAKHARGFTFTGRHENPHIAWPTAITRSKQVGGLVQCVTTREPRGGNAHRRPPPAGAGNAVSG
jgi:hypothetical protein